jgi:lipoate-protein ligase A
MLCLNRQEKDPNFNIAAEEYFLKNFEEEFMMVWINSPSIVVGKHQNLMEEVDIGYVIDHKIPVIRRISGGGTVYHDEGNINFSLIQYGEEGKLIDYHKHLSPIIKTLHHFNLNTYFGGISDLYFNNKKISGNAEHIYKNKVLHHGTLLFSTDLSILHKALGKTSDRYSSKAVKSRRRNVSNISRYLKTPLTSLEFKNHFFHQLAALFHDSEEYYISDNDRVKINDLVQKKYSTWEWNFGYSPKYKFNNKVILEDTSFLIELDVNKGIINDVVINNGKDHKPFIELLKACLLLTRHHPKFVYEKLIQSGMINFVGTDQLTHLVKQLF